MVFSAKEGVIGRGFMFEGTGVFKLRRLIVYIYIYLCMVDVWVWICGYGYNN